MLWNVYVKQGLKLYCKSSSTTVLISTATNVIGTNTFTLVGLQGGPAKVRPTYILVVTFECIGKIQ